MFRGDDVRYLQSRLNSLGFDAGREDGIFGDRAERAVREFQRNVGMEQDGIAGRQTINELERVRPATVDARSGAMLREAEALRRMKATLEGARVAIDPGHGPSDPGAVGPSGLTEADAAWELAAALHAELERRGAEPRLLRRPRRGSQRVRPRRAGQRLGRGDLRLGAPQRPHRSPRRGQHVPVLRERDDLLARRAAARRGHPGGADVSRIGLTDGRTHSMSITILRETRMPAVQVEPCFVTNPREERLLSEEPFRRDVAIAWPGGSNSSSGLGRGRSAGTGLTPPEGQARLPA